VLVWLQFGREFVGCGEERLFNREPQIRDLLSDSGLQPSLELT